MSEFVDRNGNFDFDDLAETAYKATVALNDVLDEGLPLHPLEEQRESVRDWRQMGLGIFGLADMFIKMGVRYGSEESLDICRHLGHTILNNAVLASTNLAARDGAFPKYRYEALEKSEFYQSNIDNWIKDYVKEHGIRNSQFLTIAPTGTLSSMIGVSGGIEPIFAYYYDRRTESLHDEEKIFRVYTPVVKKYMEEHGLDDTEQLPDYFVTSHGIKPIDRICVQSVWQKNIDASISSTINLPEHATVQEVADIYMNAWLNNLKGVTVFRNNCRRAGILTTPSKEEEKPIDDIPRGYILNTSDDLIGKKRKLVTGCGSLHCTAFFDPVDGTLLETYLSKGSQGGCNNFMIGLSRMISLAARGGCGIGAIVDQLKSCGVCPSYAVRRATKHDTSVGSCCPVAIANALNDMWIEMQNEIYDGYYSDSDGEHENFNRPEPVAVTKENNKDVCPECGGKLTHTGGCDVCSSCGWSKCD